MKKSRADKYMSLLLRHEPEKEGLDMDEFGYVSVKQIISKLDITMQTLEEIVSENDKQRFAFSDDHTKIRASQGHSIDVNLQLIEQEPPKILYHGTSSKSLSSIYKEGILKGKRNYVHLSLDLVTATKVGSRHGNPYVLIIDSEKMYKDGIKFYLSKNGIWLTKFVSREYIKN